MVSLDSPRLRSTAEFKPGQERGMHEGQWNVQYSESSSQTTTLH